MEAEGCSSIDNGAQYLQMPTGMTLLKEEERHMQRAELLCLTVLLPLCKGSLSEAHTSHTDSNQGPLSPLPAPD